VAPALTVGSLFSGYGGLDLGVTAAIPGARTAWHAEVEPAACRVLAHRFPDVPNLGDVARIDWSEVEPVDVLLGGFPCQDVSLAGRRLGIHPDSRSGLWTHFAYAIAQLRPALVVIENVRGLLSARAHRDLGPDEPDLADSVVLRALGAVLGDLADLGYDAAWRLVPASAVGAPHGRARVFITAWPAPADPGGEAGPLRPGLRADDPARLRRPRPDDGAAPAAYPDALGRRADLAVLPAGQPDPAGGADVDWGVYADAVARWEHITGRRAPQPLERRARGGRGLNPAFTEWMMGLPAGWVTRVPAVVDQLDLFDAPADRWAVSGEDAIKMLGNGVVPLHATAAVLGLLLDAAPDEVLEHLGLAAAIAA